MLDSKRNVEVDIAETERLLDLSSGNVPSTIRELMHRIIFLHARVENMIEVVIVDKFLGFASTGLDLKKQKSETYIGWSDLTGSVGVFLEGLNFKRKLEIATKIKAISVDDAKVITKLNDIRNKLGHIKDKRYLEFQNRENYLNALETAMVANGLFSNKPLVIDKLDIINENSNS